VIVNKRPKDTADMLREARLKRTPVRVAVLEILARDAQPLNAPQILARLPRGTDTVTLYRTLKTLTGAKLLHRVRGEDQVWRYAMSETEAGGHTHAHFVCDECGTVECLPESPVPSAPAKRARARSGYNVAYSEVLVHGTCPECHP